MSFRLFEGKSHAIHYRKFREKPPKQLIQRIINFLKEKYPGNLDTAADLGCGSGQCTFLLGEYFDRVLGTDISPAQVQEANTALGRIGLKNLTFRVASAEQIPLEDHSVQLVTICTAAHWLDLPKVYEEGRRVLCPGGVMAIFCTDIPSFLIDNSSKIIPMKEIIDWADGFLLEYFADPVKLVLNKYKDIEIPYSDFTREYGFQSDEKVSLLEILGLIRTYSAFQSYCELKGDDAGEDFLMTLQNKLVDVAELREEDFDNRVFIRSSKFFLLMGRT